MARCSWCYTEGHKKPTCPEYRSYLQRQADAGSEYHKGLLKPKPRKTRCSYCRSYGHNTKTCAVKRGLTAKITELFPNFERIVRYLGAAQGIERGARYENNYYYSNVGGIWLGEMKILSDDIASMVKWGNNPCYLRSTFVSYTGKTGIAALMTEDGVVDALNKLTPEQKEKADKLKVDMLCTVDEVVGALQGWSAAEVEGYMNKILSVL